MSVWEESKRINKTTVEWVIINFENEKKKKKIKKEVFLISLTFQFTIFYAQ